MSFFNRPSAGISWIILFLGNPGAKYSGTRHNTGFTTGDMLAERLGVKIDRLRFKSLTATAKIGDSGVLLMKPQTYMNLSGDALAPAMQFYKIPLDHCIVVSDDVSLPTGKLRIRKSGSAGGHNGLKDIIAKCGGDGFPRLKIGVGAPPHPDYDMADWVLGTFKNADADTMKEAFPRACDALEAIIISGPDKAMCSYN